MLRLQAQYAACFHGYIACWQAGLVLGPTHAASPELPKALRPNVVLIFVDDLGYGDLTCYGNTKIKTPHLDRLAKEGQRWTSFYSSGSTCVPSRTGLMSGRHPALIGKQKLSAAPKNSCRQCSSGRDMPPPFWENGAAGYPKDFTQSLMHPLECGFDYHFGTPGSNDVPAPPGKRQTREVFDHCTKFSFPCRSFAAARWWSIRPIRNCSRAATRQRL